MYEVVLKLFNYLILIKKSSLPRAMVPFKVLPLGIYSTPLPEQDVIQNQFLSGVKLFGIQFSFSVTGCLTKTKEPYYLLIDAFPKFIRPHLRFELRLPIPFLWNMTQLSQHPFHFSKQSPVLTNVHYSKPLQVVYDCWTWNQLKGLPVLVSPAGVVFASWEVMILEYTWKTHELH